MQKFLILALSALGTALAAPSNSTAPDTSNSCMVGTITAKVVGNEVETSSTADVYAFAKICLTSTADEYKDGKLYQRQIKLLSGETCNLNVDGRTKVGSESVNSYGNTEKITSSKCCDKANNTLCAREPFPEEKTLKVVYIDMMTGRRINAASALMPLTFLSAILGFAYLI